MPTANLTTTPVTAQIVRGALELEPTERGIRPHRLPAWVLAQFQDEQLAGAEAKPSAVRLAFRTRATLVELDTVPTKQVYTGMPVRPDGVYDLIVDGRLVGQERAFGGNTLTIDMAAGTATQRSGPIATVRFALPAGADRAGTERDVEIWLPHNEITEIAALRTDAPVEPTPDAGRKVWLHHGSSISQGSDAASPTTTWPARAARLGGVELVNLGFGGSALLDPFMARVIRDSPADLISIKIGINLVNADVMRVRAFTSAVHGFLDTVRDGHPDIPLLVVSPIYCAIHEDTPGPSAFDLEALSTGTLRFRALGESAPGKLTLGVIRGELERVVARRAVGDPNLHYLDGLKLYGEADFAEVPLPDQLHPDAQTHLLIAERFGELVFGAGGGFGQSST
jgi:hypothetical protein